MPIINPGTGGGSPGPQGPQGIQGFPGFGFDGIDGEDGLPIPGSQGAQGTNGTIGRDGSQGIPGEDGLNGEDSFIPGLQGIQGIQGFRGADGEDGLTNDDFWPGFNPFIDDPLEQISRIQDRNLTILPNYSAIIVGPYTINSGKKLTIGSGGRFKIEQGAPDARATVFKQQTTTFTYNGTAPAMQMAGLGATAPAQLVIPKTSGTVLLTISGDLFAVSGTINNTTIKVFTGVGTAPAAGSSGPPSGGVQIGNKAIQALSIAVSNLGFSTTVLAQNLSIGTQYWFDLSFEPNGTGVVNFTLTDTNFVATEL